MKKYRIDINLIESAFVVITANSKAEAEEKLQEEMEHMANVEREGVFSEEIVDIQEVQG